jgi:YD repeat-containing protein
MKKLRSFIILTLLLLLGNLTGSAQATYSFTYDASGNRLSRIIPLKSAHITYKDTLASQLKTFDDLIGKQLVKIYPNPTKGLLKVELPHLENQNATLQVYSAKGALIRNIVVTGTFTLIDLSSQGVGTYILRISIGELSADWKIIKD